MRHCHFKQFLVLSHANDLCDKVWLGDMGRELSSMKFGNEKFMEQKN